MSQSSELSNPGATTFSEGVLLAALRAGRASTSEVTSRTIGALIHALVAAGEAADIAGLLAPEPGARAVFEAVIQPPPMAADAIPEPAPPAVRSGLDLVGGLSELLAVDESAPSAELFSVSEGLRRRLLLRTGNGPLMFVFPAPAAFDGDPDACQGAAERWSAFLESPAGPDLAGMVKEALSDFAVEIDTKGVEEAVKRLLSDAVVEVDVQAVEAAVRQVMGETADAIKAAIVSAVDAAAERSSAEVVRPADLEDLKGAVGETARQSELAALNGAVSELVRRSDLRVVFNALHEALGEVVRRSDLPAVTEALTDALREAQAVVARASDLADVARTSDVAALGNEIRAGQAEQTVRARAAEDATRDALAGLAQRDDLANMAAATQQSLAGLARKEDIDSVAAAMEDIARKADMAAAMEDIARKADVAAAMEDIARKADMAAAMEDIARKADVAAAMEDIARKSDMAAAMEDIARKADVAALESAIQAGQADVARTSDLVALETAIKTGQADLVDRARSADNATRDAVAGLAHKDDIATATASIQEALAGIEAKVESTAADVLQATPPEVARKADVDAVVKSVRSVDKNITELARALRQQLEESQSAEPAPRPESLDVEQLSEKIARTVADQLVPQINQDDQLGGAVVAQAALLSAGEQLQIQLEAFNDRIRAGSRSLEALADELTARERVASALNDQLAASVEGSLSRLADRIDHRFADLTAGGLDPNLLAEIRDLARVLRAVAQDKVPPPAPRKSVSATAKRAPRPAKASTRKTAS